MVWRYRPEPPTVSISCRHLNAAYLVAEARGFLAGLADELEDVRVWGPKEPEGKAVERGCGLAHADISTATPLPRIGDVLDVEFSVIGGDGFASLAAS